MEEKYTLTVIRERRIDIIEFQYPNSLDSCTDLMNKYKAIEQKGRKVGQSIKSMYITNENREILVEWINK